MQRAITILLLLGQLLIGSVRGQVLCIPLCVCEEHAAERHHTHCDHHHAPSCHHHSSHQHDDQKSGQSGHWGFDMHAACECHLHVPLPEAPQHPTTIETFGAAHEYKPLATAPAIASLDSEREPTVSVPRPHARSDISGRESRLSITTIRLRI